MPLQDRESRVQCFRGGPLLTNSCKQKNLYSGYPMAVWHIKIINIAFLSLRGDTKSG